MRREKPFDPLTCIPRPETIRQKLAETECLAQRLRILLQTAEAIEQTERCRPHAAKETAACS